MSDDERMDRARRIRRLREGQRSDDDADDESEDRPDDDADREQAGKTPSAETAGATASGETGGDGTDGRTDLDMNDDQTRDSETDDTAADTTSGEPSGSSTDPSGHGTSAAADAASAASQFESSDRTAADTDPDPAGTEPDPAKTDPEPARSDDRETGSAPGAGDPGDPTAAPVRDDQTDVGPDDVAEPVAETARREDADGSRNAAAQLLEFRLGDQRYCLNIMLVEEIVKDERITRVPNTPEFVRGVVDLRGHVTTILDPTESIGVEGGGDGEQIVVFDEDTFEDQGRVGWVVDEVDRVTPVEASEVKDPPMENEHVNGVLERDGEFVVWIDPEIALDDEDGEDR